MIDKKYIELINKEIDGVITKVEQERLHSYLSTNPEAQNFYDELRQTSELLSKIPKLEPSPNIKTYVMNSIDLNRYVKAKKPFRFKSFVPNLLTRPIPKLAYAFALGILVGILVYSVLLENMISKRGLEVTDFYGTIGVDEKSSFKTIQTIPIALPEINGTITIKRHRNIIVIETDLSSQQEIEIRFDYDESYLRFSHFNSGSKAKIAFESGENYVRSLSAGDIQFILFFNEVVADGKPVVLKISIAGEVRFTHNITL